MNVTNSNLFKVLSQTGALVAFVFRFSVILIGNRQNFSMATNFMQKIYSVDGKHDKRPNDDSDGDDKGVGEDNQQLKRMPTRESSILNDSFKDNEAGQGANVND